MSKRIAAISFVALSALAMGQDKPPVPAAPPVKKPAAAPTAAGSPVDTVIQLLQGGMSESSVVKMLQRQNKPVNLSPADMLKLQKAKVSELVMDTLIDPGAGHAAAATNVSPAPPTVQPTKSAAPVATAPQPETSAAAACAPPAAVAAVANARKRRLAVTPFDFAAVQTQVTAIFGNSVNVGQGIRAMLTDKMAQSKTVVLLEREKIQAVMAEQNFGATNRVKPGTKPKIGGLTGADAILFGDITIFGRDDTQKKNAAGGFLGGLGGPIGGLAGGIANSKRTDKAVVAITLRLVDAETGETLETASARGESKRTSTDWGAIAGSWRGAAAASSGMNSSNFQETIIGEATLDAVTKIADFINQRVPAIGAKAREIEGKVATIEGCNLYLTIGGNDGVQVGDHFEIHKIIREVIDPDTKAVIDLQTEKVGEFVAATVRPAVTIGQYGGLPISSSNVPKPGYAARLVQ